ncbi:MAG: hypothetical protein KKG92_07165 [Gammaproteobacteria bacterium]|nr:hypothetical protein [Gammaproteobacteria bacterium]MDP2430669.1 DUF6516 family protein [Pseudomonadota bacterium]
MDEALAAWLERAVAHLITWPLSRHVATEYAETGYGVAQYRVRVALVDGSLLQCVERARNLGGLLQTEKYSFHWQAADGTLICRWDNAPHHHELPGFPHHLHVGTEANVFTHNPVTVFTLTELIENRFSAP